VAQCKQLSLLYCSASASVAAAKRTNKLVIVVWNTARYYESHSW